MGTQKDTTTEVVFFAEIYFLTPWYSFSNRMEPLGQMNAKRLICWGLCVSLLTRRRLPGTFLRLAEW